MIPFTCLTTDDIPIRGELYASDRSHGHPVILAHGLPAGKPDPEVASDEGYPGLARRLSALGFDTAIFNFRGTGESGGHLEIDLWPLDLGAVLDHLEIAGYGRSFTVAGFSAGGAASIIRSASDERIRHLITLAAPADYGFLYAISDPDEWFVLYKSLGMIREGYTGTSEEWSARFRKVLPREDMAFSKAERIDIIHGDADETVPVEHAAILSAAAGPRAKVHILPGVTHRMRRDERAVAALVQVLTTMRL